jgi:non-ribosomal peptide synthetase component F
LLGLFLNTVALRVRVAPTQPFRALVEATRGRARRGRAPGRAVRARRRCGEAAGAARRRMAAREVRPAVRRAARQLLPGATAVATPGPDLAARFDFALDFTDDASGIALVAAYATDCIDADTARAWLELCRSSRAPRTTRRPSRRSCRAMRRPRRASRATVVAARRACRRGRRVRAAGGRIRIASRSPMHRRR